MDDQEVRVLGTKLGVSSPVEFSTDYLAGGCWMDYMLGYLSSFSLFVYSLNPAHTELAFSRVPFHSMKGNIHVIVFPAGCLLQCLSLLPEEVRICRAQPEACRGSHLCVLK